MFLMNHYFSILPWDPPVLTLWHHPRVPPASMPGPAVHMIGMSRSLFVGVPANRNILKPHFNQNSSLMSRGLISKWNLDINVKVVDPCYLILTCSIYSICFTRAQPSAFRNEAVGPEETLSIAWVLGGVIIIIDLLGWGSTLHRRPGHMNGNDAASWLD